MTRATDPGSVLAVGRWGRVTCLVLALAAGACRGESRQTQPDKGGGSVVVHSSADKEFAELIFRAYEQKTGVGVLPLYDTEETKTAGLTARLLAERGRRLLVVRHQPGGGDRRAGRRRPLRTERPNADFRAVSQRSGLWTGFGARIRVLLYNTNNVRPEDAPRSILDLTQPRWKGRFAIFPSCFAGRSEEPGHASRARATIHLSSSVEER